MKLTKSKSNAPTAPLPPAALIRCELRRDAYALANVLLTQGPLPPTGIAAFLEVSEERASYALDFLKRVDVAQLSKGGARLTDGLEDRWFWCPHSAFRFIRDIVKPAFSAACERWDFAQNPHPLCWIGATTHPELECALFELGSDVEDERVGRLNDARDGHPIFGDIFSGVNDDAELALARARLRFLSFLVQGGVDAAGAEAALTAYYSEVEAVLFVSPEELVRH